jgi:hypothetical protein
MSGSKFSVSRGVVCERVGDELMIVVPGHAEVVKLKGEAADVFLDVQAGRTPHASGNLTSELEALGIIEASGMSRRGLIKAGAIGAGAGIAVMAMPSVAMASSGDEPRIIPMSYGGFETGVSGVSAKLLEFGGKSLVRAPISLSIPNGTSAVFKSGDLEIPITISNFGDNDLDDDLRPWITITFTPFAASSNFAEGNVATITIESLNVILTYTFKDGDV